MVMRGDGMLSLAAAAQRLGVRYLAAYNLMLRGRLPGKRRGRFWFVRAADVERQRRARRDGRRSDG